MSKKHHEITTEMHLTLGESERELEREREKNIMYTILYIYILLYIYTHIHTYILDYSHGLPSKIIQITHPPTTSISPGPVTAGFHCSAAGAEGLGCGRCEAVQLTSLRWGAHEKTGVLRPTNIHMLMYVLYTLYIYIYL